MNHLIHRVELALWDRIIPMLSDSPVIRQAVRIGYQIIQDRTSIIQSSFVIALSGAIGLVVGLILLKVAA